MAVTTTVLGSNSAKIDYDAGTALASLVAAIDTYITAHGWASYDVVSATKVVYRAINKDATTYKYVELNYATPGSLFVKVWESWNNGTHVGTNLAGQSDVAAYAQRVDLTNGGTLYLFVYDRYLILCSSNSGVIGSSIGNSWCGCLEFARDNPEDTAAMGYPCWVWSNGTRMGSDFAYPVTIPRTRAGTTGDGAAGKNFVSTYLGIGGIMPGGSGNGYGLYQCTPAYVNAWSGKNWALTLRVGKVGLLTSDGAQFPQVFGRLFGLHLLTRTVGSFMDDIPIKIDADFFYDPAGALTSHWVITETPNLMRYAIPK